MALKKNKEKKKDKFVALIIIICLHYFVIYKGKINQLC